MVPYAERRQRRLRSGEDYQYGLHVLRVLERMHGDSERNGEPQSWAEVCKKTTAEINSSGDAPDYKITDKAHIRELRKTCSLLRELGVIVSDQREQIPDKELMQNDGWAWVARQSWRISGLGLKVLYRTMQRESKDEQYAVFERFYRRGPLPTPIAGEEYGHHHHEYLERILPTRDATGDFVVRADDKRSVGFLIRARVIRARKKPEADKDPEPWEEITFRYIEFPIEADPQAGGIPVVSQASDIRRKVDEVWPRDGLIASRPQAHKILADLVDSDARADSGGSDSYDLPALHYLAWNRCSDDIVGEWSSGTDESALDFTVPRQLTDAIEFLEDSSGPESNFDNEMDALNRSYPIDIVRAVESIMDSDGLDDEQRLDALLRLIEERNLVKISLPKIQPSISSSQVELESWIAFLPI